MNKEFVPYNESLELKQLGFDEPCFANYTVVPEDDINWFTIPEQGITDKTKFGSSKNYNTKVFEEEGTISAPTFSQAFRWFREKYGLIHCIQMSGIKSISYDIRKLTEHHYKTIEFSFCSLDGSNTYEKAELACLRKLIEIVKNK